MPSQTDEKQRDEILKRMLAMRPEPQKKRTPRTKKKRKKKR